MLCQLVYLLKDASPGTPMNQGTEPEIQKRKKEKREKGVLNRNPAC